MRFLYYLWFSVLFICSLNGCASNGDSRLPLKVQHYGTVHSGEQLVVFFPGINSSGQDFEAYDLLTPFIERYPQADILLVDTRLAYIEAGNIASRIQQEIIIPAKKKGYKKIWFVGISLGGLGTLIYNKNYPDNINGIVLMAPFIGGDDIVDSILSAPSPQEWARINANSEIKAVQMWRHLISYNDQTPIIDNNKVKLLLAFGKDDRFVRSHQLLASFMEPDNVFQGPGEHNWLTWRELWIEMLDKNIFNDF